MPSTYNEKKTLSPYGVNTKSDGKLLFIGSNGKIPGNIRGGNLGNRVGNLNLSGKIFLSEEKRLRSDGSEAKKGGFLKNEVFDRVSCRTRAGFNGYTVKTNQDSFFIDKLFMGSPKKAFFGVFDGHGSQGHKVSAY